MQHTSNDFTTELEQLRSRVITAIYEQYEKTGNCDISGSPDFCSTADFTHVHHDGDSLHVDIQDFEAEAKAWWIENEMLTVPDLIHILSELEEAETE